MVAALGLLLAVIDVAASTDCPAAADVQAKLGPLLPAGEAPPERRQVRIARAADALVVEMWNAAGAKLAERRLGLGASCADLASAAAVVIATWEVELRGQGTLALWLEREAPPRPTASPGRVWLGAGGYGARARASLTYAAELELAVEEGRWAGVLDAFHVGDHRAALGPGDARWQRSGLGLGGRVAAGGAGWEVVGSVMGLVGLLTLRGDRLDAARQETVLDAGGQAGVRLGWKSPRLRPWLGVNVVVWPIVRTVTAEGLPDRRDLPRWEALIGAGTALSLRP